MKLHSQMKNDVLRALAEHILSSLDELTDVPLGGDFILGQKYAYVECLELLQCLASPSELHIDFVIEDKYPLE
mgnify:FL=1